MEKRNLVTYLIGQDGQDKVKTKTMRRNVLITRIIKVRCSSYTNNNNKLQDMQHDVQNLPV